MPDYRYGSPDGKDISPASVTTDDLSLGGAYEYAADDSELTSLLGSVGGKTVLLGNSNFSTDRTFDDRSQFVGSGSITNFGSEIAGTWTNTRAVLIDKVALSGTLNYEGSRGRVSDVDAYDGGTINVRGSVVTLSGITGGTVTFESGTSNGIIDSSAGVSVTDNGSNTVGDIT